MPKFWLQGGKIIVDNGNGPVYSVPCPCEDCWLVNICDLCEQVPDKLCVYFETPQCTNLSSNKGGSYFGQKLELTFTGTSGLCLWEGLFVPDCWISGPFGHGGSIGSGSCPDPALVGGFIISDDAFAPDCFVLDCEATNGWFFREEVSPGVFLVAVPGPCALDAFQSGAANQLCCPVDTIPLSLTVTVSGPNYNGSVVITGGNKCGAFDAITIAVSGWSGPNAFGTVPWINECVAFSEPVATLRCCGPGIGWTFELNDVGSSNPPCMTTPTPISPTSVSCNPFSLTFDLSSLTTGQAGGSWAGHTAVITP